MQIALRDRDKTPIWNLPGTKYILTYENPGPLDLDPKGLTVDQRKVVWSGLQRQVLAGKDLDILKALIDASSGQSVAKKYAMTDSGEFVLVVDTQPPKQSLNILPLEVKESTKSISNTSPSEEFITIANVQETISSLREGQLAKFKSLLYKRIQTIKKELGSMTLSELRAIRELETNNKAREAVLTMINDMIAKIQGQVSASIAANQGTYIVKERKESLQITDIEDSDFKDVKIKMGAIDEEI